MKQKVKHILDKLDNINRKKQKRKINSVKDEIKIIKPKLSAEEMDRLNSEFFYSELRKVHENNDTLALETLKELRR